MGMEWNTWWAVRHNKVACQRLFLILLCGLENCTEISLGLPCWLIGKESTCQCRRYEFNPWSRKNPHATEQINLGATTVEPVLQSLRATATEPSSCNYWSLQAPESVLSKEKPLQWDVHTLQLETSPHLSQRRPSTAKQTDKNVKIFPWTRRQ